MPSQGNSVVGKRLRVHLPDGLTHDPFVIGPDTVEYTVAGGDRAGRHAIQRHLYYRIAPGIEATGWCEESGAIVHLVWFWETRTTHRFSSVPAWLAKDFSVYAGDNQDPEFIAKIRALSDQGPELPRSLRSDDGWFEVLDP